MRVKFSFSLLVVFTLFGCGGGSSGGSSATTRPPVVPPPPSGPQLYSLNRDNATLHRIDPDSGAFLDFVAINLTGQLLDGGRGLAANPVTGQLFGAFQPQSGAGGGRLIAMIDPVSGMGTLISTEAGRAGALAFDSTGTLYTGEAANTGQDFANKLYVIDTVTGERTEFMPIAISEAGIALALNPLDGLIYHLSGSLIFGTDITTPIFEKIDPETQTRIEIPVSGDDMGHVRAMTYWEDGNFLVVGTFEPFGPSQTTGRLFRLTPAGVATELGLMSHKSKGIAVIPPVQAPVTFSDVKTDHWAYSAVQKLSMISPTENCAGDNFCPDDAITRAQLAVFLEYGLHGTDYNPPIATSNAFLDVASNDLTASFIEHLFLDGIIGGCGGNKFCPDDVVTHGQVAEYLLRAEHGVGYFPPAPTGIFLDVDLAHPAAGWIEQLATEGFATGCGGGNYCPDWPVMRVEMADFVVRVFAL